VGNDNDRDSRFVQLAQNCEDLLLACAVQIAGRLIGQDDARPVDQGARDRYTLLLAAGKFVGSMPGALA
jgi:hypothetical protein